ncbi:DUF4126 family protein [Mucilaginibacter sp. AW1-3]
MTKLPNYLIPSLALGALSGMRSFTGLALTAYMLNRNPSRTLERSHLPFKHLQSPAVANTIAVLALGELIGDKLPFTPNRTNALPLTGRVVSGAFTSATLLKAKNGNAVTGLILGGACALAATFASFYLRKAVTGHGKLSNVAAGLIEDGLVLGAGALLVSKFNTSKVK